MQRRLVQVSLLMMALTAPRLHAEKAVEPAAPTEALRRLVTQLRELRQDYYRQKDRDEAEIEEARRNRDLLRSQVEELREQQATLDAELANYQSQVRTLEAERQSKAAVRREIDHNLETFVSAQATQIQEGIPYKQSDRLAPLQAPPADPNDPATTSVAARLSGLWSYSQQELHLAASSETYSERATLEEGTTPYARYFRVGQLILAYVTEDGQKAAVWLNEPQGGRWRLISDPKQFAPLRDAVEILDRQQMPRFVSLLIILNTQDSDQ